MSPRRSAPMINRTNRLFDLIVLQVRLAIATSERHNDMSIKPRKRQQNRIIFLFTFPYNIMNYDIPNRFLIILTT